MQDLNKLANSGNMVLTFAIGASADGTVIAGHGLAPQPGSHFDGTVPSGGSFALISLPWHSAIAGSYQPAACPLMPYSNSEPAKRLSRNRSVFGDPEEEFRGNT